MGSLGGLTGTGGGAGGSGFEGPKAADISNPVTQDQINTSYLGNQDALAAQQGLLQALQAQNGIGNQSQVYNQLQGVVNGTGPNPAQAMLNQATGQNVANQAALMAGQRGAASNVGLMARQAATQGAGIQQQAVGQGATMQANQSLNALGQAGNIAGQQVGNQIGATSANTAAQQAEQNSLLNAQAAYNNASVGSQSSINAANAGLAQTTMKGQQSMIGGAMNGAAAAFGAQGGMAVKMADGGALETSKKFLKGAAQPTGQEQVDPLERGMSSFTTALLKPSQPQIQGSAGELPGAGDVSQDEVPENTVMAPAMEPAPMAAPTMMAAEGGETHDYRSGGNVDAANQAQKAVVKGNSYANDKIPAVLSEGEVVIPRDVMESDDPAGAAAKFVQGVLSKRKTQKFAEGGTPDPAEDLLGAEDVAQPAPVQAAPQPQEPPAEVDPVDQANAQVEDAAPQKLIKALSQPTPMQAMAEKYQADKMAHKENEIADHEKFANDLVNQHITPKTYHDLFSKNEDGSEKGTLSKIGTLFGMIVGGAGSGLSGQPNLLMHMMDKEIDRDLQAQMKSKENAQNFYRVNQADIQAKTSGALTVEQAKVAAYNRAKAQMLQTSYHDLMQKVSKMPADQQAKYRQAMMVLYPELKAQLNNASDLAATAMAAGGNNPFGKPKAQGQPEAKAKPQVKGKPKNTVDEYDENQKEAIEPIVSPGAEGMLKNIATSQRPDLYPFKDEISSQLAEAKRAERALVEVNRIFPRMRQNSNSKTGYLMRKATNLSGTPYIGPMADGIGALVGDFGDQNKEQNRQYNTDEKALLAQLRNAMPNANDSTLHEMIMAARPESGDSPQLYQQKLLGLRNKVLSNLKLDKLEMAGMLHKKGKR